MNIVLWLIFGALAGWLAGLIMKTDHGFWGRVLLGIVGSAVGRLLAGLIGIHADQISIGGILISVAGACVVVWLVRKLTGKK